MALTDEVMERFVGVSITGAVNAACCRTQGPPAVVQEGHIPNRAPPTPPNQSLVLTQHHCCGA